MVPPVPVPVPPVPLEDPPDPLVVVLPVPDVVVEPLVVEPLVVEPLVVEPLVVEPLVVEPLVPPEPVVVVLRVEGVSSVELQAHAAITSMLGARA